MLRADSAWKFNGEVFEGEVFHHSQVLELLLTDPVIVARVDGSFGMLSTRRMGGKGSMSRNACCFTVGIPRLRGRDPARAGFPRSVPP
jgi:hypothetical protein